MKRRAIARARAKHMATKAGSSGRSGGGNQVQLLTVGRKRLVRGKLVARHQDTVHVVEHLHPEQAKVANDSKAEKVHHSANAHNAGVGQSQVLSTVADRVHTIARGEQVEVAGVHKLDLDIEKHGFLDDATLDVGSFERLNEHPHNQRRGVKFVLVQLLVGGIAVHDVGSPKRGLDVELLPVPWHGDLLRLGGVCRQVGRVPGSTNNKQKQVQNCVATPGNSQSVSQSATGACDGACWQPATGFLAYQARRAGEGRGVGAAHTCASHYGRTYIGSAVISTVWDTLSSGLGGVIFSSRGLSLMTYDLRLRFFLLARFFFRFLAAAMAAADPPAAVPAPPSAVTSGVEAAVAAFEDSSVASAGTFAGEGCF